MVKCRINGFSSPLREGCVMMRRQGVTHVYDSRVGSALQGAQRVSSPEYERKVDDQQQYTVYIGGEDAMLSNYPIDVVLLATDLAAAKEFYAGKIGLPALSETEGGVTFQCGGDSHLVVTKSSVGTKDEQTQAAFRVAEVRAEVSELRRRGVQIEDYDLPGLKTQDGIADIGFAWMAWFIDPAKNCVGLIQLKNP
jgi:predicted enzyme related to lactoylglutathione lyase